jgi:hypothetical protein
MEEEEKSPCDDCGESDYCDMWEAQFCCELCRYMHGGEQPPWCDDCDPWDI